MAQEHTQDATVTYFTYPDITQARFAQDTLKTNGIESFLKNENVLGMDPMSGVELKIFEKDLAHVQQILIINK